MEFPKPEDVSWKVDGGKDFRVVTFGPKNQSNLDPAWYRSAAACFPKSATLDLCFFSPTKKPRLFWKEYSQISTSNVVEDTKRFW